METGGGLVSGGGGGGGRKLNGAMAVSAVGTGGGLVSEGGGGVGRKLNGAMEVLAVQGAGVEPGKQMELGSVNFVHSPITKNDPNRDMIIEEGVIRIKEENLGRVFVLCAMRKTCHPSTGFLVK